MIGEYSYILNKHVSDQLNVISSEAITLQGEIALKILIAMIQNPTSVAQMNHELTVKSAFNLAEKFVDEATKRDCVVDITPNIEEILSN